MSMRFRAGIFEGGDAVGEAGVAVWAQAQVGFVEVPAPVAAESQLVRAAG